MFTWTIEILHEPKAYVCDYSFDFNSYRFASH